MKIEKNLIKELVDYLNEFNLTELEYQDGTKKIKVSKTTKGVVSQNISDNLVSTNKAVLNESLETNGVRIKSPIIGTAYLASEPGGKPFILSLIHI